MGEHSLDPFVEWVERPRRTVQEPLRARSKHVRVQLGFGWCRCRVLLCCRDRFRDRWLRDIAKRGVRGARIGVARETNMGYSPKTDKLVEQAIEVLKHAGATVVDPANMPGPAKIGDAELEVLLYELKADLNSYLESLGPGAPYKTL